MHDALLEGRRGVGTRILFAAIACDEIHKKRWIGTAGGGVLELRSQRESGTNGIGEGVREGGGGIATERGGNGRAARSIDDHGTNRRGRRGGRKIQPSEGIVASEGSTHRLGGDATEDQKRIIHGKGIEVTASVDTADQVNYTCGCD